MPVVKPACSSYTLDLNPKGAPEKGKHLVDDKGGDDPFKLGQAEDYSNAFGPDGKIRSGGKEYDGLVYFFHSLEEAADAAAKMDDAGLNSKLTVGYFDSKGNLKWVERKPKPKAQPEI